MLIRPSLRPTIATIDQRKNLTPSILYYRIVSVNPLAAELSRLVYQYQTERSTKSLSKLNMYQEIDLVSTQLAKVAISQESYITILTISFTIRKTYTLLDTPILTTVCPLFDILADTKKEYLLLLLPQRQLIDDQLIIASLSVRLIKYSLKKKLTALTYSTTKYISQLNRKRLFLIRLRSAQPTQEIYSMVIRSILNRLVLIDLTTLSSSPTTPYEPALYNLSDDR